jgi:hypothetical protein
VPAEPTTTITWTQTGGPTVGVNNALDPVTFSAPAAATVGAIFNLTLQATGSASGFSNGTDSVQITTLPVDVANLATKSSGAAQPGDTVTVDLADIEPETLVPSWVQDVNDATRVALTPQPGTQTATFTAPGVQTTTNLHFVAVVGCPRVGVDPIRSGALTVPIQVATVVIELPPDGFAEGTQENLYQFTNVNGNGVGVEDAASLAAKGLELLFFASAEGNGSPPSGVDVSINQDTGVLTITSGAGETIKITGRLFGTAGELAFDDDTVLIVAGGD